MPVLVIGGDEPEKDEAPKAKMTFGKKKVPSYIGGDAKDEAGEDGEGADREEQMQAAADQILSAISARNSRKLRTALEAFYLACDVDDEPDGDEE